MSYKLKTNLANSKNYGGTRKASQIKFLVIHYTANDGDSDEGNGNYFHNNVVGSSAHYFVDDDSVTQTVPDLRTAWSVGGARWSDAAKTGGGTMYGKITNANSISIEMCDSIRDGKVIATETTMQNTAELCRVLMKKYGISVENVYRHFDVNGKHCPAYLMDASKWNAFKSRLTVASSIESTKPVVNSQSAKALYKVTADILNVRSGPGTNYPRVTAVKKNEVYTIVETSGGWGKLKSGAGWISLAYTTKL